MQRQMNGGQQVLELPPSPSLSAIVKQTINLLQIIEDELSSGPQKTQSLSLGISEIQRKLEKVDFIALEEEIRQHRVESLQKDRRTAHNEFEMLRKSRENHLKKLVSFVSQVIGKDF